MRTITIEPAGSGPLHGGSNGHSNGAAVEIPVPPAALPGLTPAPAAVPAVAHLPVAPHPPVEDRLYYRSMFNPPHSWRRDFSPARLFGLLALCIAIPGGFAAAVVCLFPVPNVVGAGGYGSCGQAIGAQALYVSLWALVLLPNGFAFGAMEYAAVYVRLRLLSPSAPFDVCGCGCRCRCCPGVDDEEHDDDGAAEDDADAADGPPPSLSPELSPSAVVPVAGDALTPGPSAVGPASASASASLPRHHRTELPLPRLWVERPIPTRARDAVTGAPVGFVSDSVPFRAWYMVAMWAFAVVSALLSVGLAHGLLEAGSVVIYVAVALSSRLYHILYFGCCARVRSVDIPPLPHAPPQNGALPAAAADAAAPAVPPPSSPVPPASERRSVLSLVFASPITAASRAASVMALLFFPVVLLFLISYRRATDSFVQNGLVIALGLAECGIRVALSAAFGAQHPSASNCGWSSVCAAEAVGTPNSTPLPQRLQLRPLLPPQWPLRAVPVACQWSRRASDRVGRMTCM
jgi:hypothetical protein